MIGDLAARQHGVVARRQLLDAGITAGAMERRVASGHLVRLHRGVYAVGHAQLRREGRWLAAVLAAGPGAALSHRSAAALHGIRESDGAIDVTTTRRAATRGVVVHRTTSLDAKDLTTRRGVPVTTLPRALVDLAGTLAPEQLGKLVREADRAGRLTAGMVRQARERVAHRRDAAAKALQAALDAHERLATSRTRSELEDHFLALLDAEDLPRPRTNHPVAGFELDAAWLQERLAVELDSWTWHRDRASFQNDRARDVALARAGWRVLRFTHADVIDRPAHVAATLRELLAR